MVADPHGAARLLECRAINTITVADEVSWSFFPRKRLGHLSGDPPGGRVGSDVGPNQAASSQADNDQTVQQVKANGRNHEQIDRRDAIGMILAEPLRSPA
jgi:hypothetical protein